MTTTISQNNILKALHTLHNPQHQDWPQMNFCHLARRDCGNAGTVEEGTDATIVSRSESGEDNPQAGLNISILPRP